MTERYTDWRSRKSRRLRSLSTRRAVYTLHKLRSWLWIWRACEALTILSHPRRRPSFETIVQLVATCRRKLTSIFKLIWSIQTKYSVLVFVGPWGPGVIVNALLVGKGGYALKYASPSEGKLQWSFWMSWAPECAGTVVPASLRMFLGRNTPSCHDLVFPSLVPFFLFVCLSVCLSICLSVFVTTLANHKYPQITS